MTIRYANGLTKEGVLLSRTTESLRVAVEGLDDVTELRRVNGVWITDDCEPVQISFAWEREPAPEISEVDCICPPEVAARIIRLLYTEEEESLVQTASSVERATAAAFLV